MADSVEITFLDGDRVSVKLPGRSLPHEAKALYVGRDDTGRVNELVLDRRIHPPKTTVLGEWNVSGGVCSELSRPVISSR